MTYIKPNMERIPLNFSNSEMKTLNTWKPTMGHKTCIFTQT